MKFSEVDPEDEVWILDYSFGDEKIDIFRKLVETNGNITWIDHHNTSIKFCKKYPNLVSRTNRNIILEGLSGAALTYLAVNDEPSGHVFQESRLPRFLKYISDFDCWTKKYNFSNFFKLGMDVNGYKDVHASIWAILCTESSDNIMDDIIKDGTVVMQYIRNDYKSIRESIGFESEINGIKCFCVNSEGNSWMFGDLMEKYPLCALFTFDGEMYTVSLYSEGQQDCSVIAAAHGGGGHPGASGFRCKELPFKK